MLKMRSATANISDEVESCISYARQYIEEARNGRGYDKVCSAHKALEWLIKAFSISPIATETVIPYIVEALYLLYKGLSEAFGIDIVRSLLEKAKQSSGEDKVRYALNALVLAEIIGKLDLRDEAFQLICEGENEKRRKLQEELQQQQREI